MTADALFGAGALVLCVFNTIAILDTRAAMVRLVRGGRR